MIIFKRAEQLSEYLGKQKESGKKIGFVPTMGALHRGHLSLIEAARKSSEIVVCSIFINPTQFNNPEDFKLYPVTVEKDIEQLYSAGSDVLFLPPLEEIYPPGYRKKHFDLGPIENILEGKYRPGHFQGVCEVVDRLLEIVQPNDLYLGQKDFQQCMVIKKLIELTGRDRAIRLHIVPTEREKDGLAMSSRNLRLNEAERKQAPAIFKVLSRIGESIHRQSPEQLKVSAEEELVRQGFVVDYVEIAQRNDLSAATNGNAPLVALVAATIGRIRLIDNLFIGEKL
jgi:pantoate--beta-alanine ligase